MNKLKLDNTGGFPLDTNVLDFMQNSYTLFNHLGHLAGDLAIISGCKVTGSSVSDGVVFIGGELLPFKGGSAFTSVIIKEEKRALPFEDGESKEVEITRYATFGAGTTAYNWADFKRPPSLSALEDHLIRLFSEKAEVEDLVRAERRLGALEAKTPMIGEIRQGIFDLEHLEEGWYYCDGTHGTPDLRGYFLRGASGTRQKGTFQEDAQQNITGEFPVNDRENLGGNPKGVFSKKKNFSTWLKSSSEGDDWGKIISLDTSRQIRTADEVRPKNYAVHFIMYMGK
uniref:hypothetical protein n=1 Tax=Ornithobacterium rhinotracheale TaxID=28251 RepID=UPI0039A5EF73